MLSDGISENKMEEMIDTNALTGHDIEQMELCSMI